ncbi:hypothetical protein MY04_1457 [Flammeovirga sp. MY04]|uniref:hypothetical protein n=1 Tax=Flammeovirga sp. MY04 TaxID=1191459 RepID=UPI0008061D3B|nr:hypothetical protein [Flammeovirga sp. MY04]ANQ48833.1 hypothetical protein MY04_1457 [Flammeovirga sp. MY04]
MGGKFPSILCHKNIFQNKLSAEECIALKIAEKLMIKNDKSDIISGIKSSSDVPLSNYNF